MKPICSLTSRHLNEDPPNKDKVVENFFGSVKLQPAVRAMSFRPTRYIHCARKESNCRRTVKFLAKFLRPNRFQSRAPRADVQNP
jgi:hypothetical protein